MHGATERSCTIRHCVVLAEAADLQRPHAGRPLLFWRLRELVRFGVTEFLFTGRGISAPDEAAIRQIAAALPRAVRIHVGTDPALTDADRVFVLSGTELFAGNLAIALTADPAWAVLITSAGRATGLAIAPPQMIGRLETLPRLVIPGRTFGPADPGLPLRRPALLLDRDGTVNVDHGYVGSRARFTWIDGALEAVARATAAGWHVFIVTNQSGIARGFYDEPAVAELHDWVADEMRRGGGTIDDVRICPFHPDAVRAEYRRASDWRKPAPGMLLDLVRAWDLDAKSCHMVGDQPSDVAAAQAAGMHGHLFPGGSLDQFVRPLLSPTDAQAAARIVETTGMGAS